MTGLDGRRVYLDWNATAPLRPEARASMLAAMDLVGNPSSVHAEGRAARAIVEGARGQVARLVGCEPSEVVFTSGATEATALVLRSGFGGCRYSLGAHDCILRNLPDGQANLGMPLDRDGLTAMEPDDGFFSGLDERQLFAWSVANGETGVFDADPCLPGLLKRGRVLEDAVQCHGKLERAFRAGAADFAIVSGHKFGAPKGVGALVVRTGVELSAVIGGGGQEAGRRSGTENVIGIAGLGAAAEAARRDLEAGLWERIAQLRDALEERLESAAPDLILVGKVAPRLPNTSCFAVPGWAGETQVMQMDLAGFAVSAGSACASGKVTRASRVLLAMGFDEVTASSAIRISMGPTTTEVEVLAFAEAWIDRYRRRNSRAA